MRLQVVAVSLAAALVACGGKSSTSDAGSDAGASDAGPVDAGPGAPLLDPSASLNRLQDQNPDPNIVEVNLSASNTAQWDLGNSTVVPSLAYNGVHPGPLLEAKLGDTVIIHFKNDLPWKTSIHWHGLRVPDSMDGTMLGQNPIAPGASFDYQFVARDPGLFWYHPHIADHVQVELGLYGAILIHQPGEPDASTLAVDQPLMLDDVLIENGQISGMDVNGPDPMDAPMASSNEMMDGRLGNVLLANGKANLRIPVTAGGWALFRLVNASNARHMVLSLEGHQLVIVGLDQGFAPDPKPVTSLTIAPGERYSVLVKLDGQPGQEYRWMSSSFAMGMGITDPLGSAPQPVATVVYGADSQATPAQPAFPTADAPQYQPSNARTHIWQLGMAMSGSDMIHTIDGAQWPNVPLLSYPANGDYTFVIQNTDMEVHPFHLHGQRFQVVAATGSLPNDYAGMHGWKDTVVVEPNAAVEIRTALDNPGHWMYHCHILEHADMGMMGELDVQ